MEIVYRNRRRPRRTIRSGDTNGKYAFYNPLKIRVNACGRFPDDVSFADRILYRLVEIDDQLHTDNVHTPDSILKDGYARIRDVVNEQRNATKEMQPAFLIDDDGSYAPICLFEYLRRKLSEMGELKADHYNDDRVVYRTLIEKMYDSVDKETIYANITTLGNWNDNGFPTDRKDSYEILMRMIFALKLSYDDAKEFCHNIGARHLYALDCHDHVFIIALIYNELAREHKSHEITYDEAKAIADKAGGFVCERIQEEIDKKQQTDPNADIKVVCSDVLREMYEDARNRAGSDPTNRITQFTEDATNIAKNTTITGFSTGVSFEEIVKKSVSENTVAMFRARRTLMALILTYIYGSRDNIPAKLGKDIRDWLNAFNKLDESDDILLYMRAMVNDDHDTLMGILSSDVENKIRMHEDEARGKISDGRINAFKSAFSLSLSSLVTGSIYTLFTREELFRICFASQKITPARINALLEAAGESRLNENFYSDAGIIACQTVLDYYMSGRYTDDEVRKIFIEYLDKPSENGSNSYYGLKELI